MIRQVNSQCLWKFIYKFLICIFLLLLLVGCSNTTNKETEAIKSISIDEKGKDLEVSENEIITTIKDVAQDPRVLGTEGEKKKAKYLKEVIF